MITNTLNYFNLQLKTLVEGSIIVYTSSQVVSRVLCRDHDQQEAGGQEEHLGAESRSAQGLPGQILADFVDCVPSKIIRLLLREWGYGYKVAWSDFWPGFSRLWRESLDVELHQRLIVMPVTF